MNRRGAQSGVRPQPLGLPGPLSAPAPFDKFHTAVVFWKYTSGTNVHKSWFSCACNCRAGSEPRLCCLLPSCGEPWASWLRLWKAFSLLRWVVSIQLPVSCWSQNCASSDSPLKREERKSCRRNQPPSEFAGNMFHSQHFFLTGDLRSICSKDEGCHFGKKGGCRVRQPQTKRCSAICLFQQSRHKTLHRFDFGIRYCSPWEQLVLNGSFSFRLHSSMFCHTSGFQLILHESSTKAVWLSKVWQNCHRTLADKRVCFSEQNWKEDSPAPSSCAAPCSRPWRRSSGASRGRRRCPSRATLSLCRRLPTRGRAGTGCGGAGCTTSCAESSKDPSSKSSWLLSAMRCGPVFIPAVEVKAVVKDWCDAKKAWNLAGRFESNVAHTPEQVTVVLCSPGSHLLTAASQVTLQWIAPKWALNALNHWAIIQVLRQPWKAFHRNCDE